nr:unnamed protein product [Digitaria exilis]
MKVAQSAILLRRGGLEEVLSQVAVDLVPADPVEHEHDPHGERGVEARAHPEDEHVPPHHHVRVLVHLPPHLRHHHVLLLPAVGPAAPGLGGGDDPAAPARERSVDVELPGGARGEEVDEHGGGAGPGAEDGGAARGEEGLRVAVRGAVPEEAVPAVVQAGPAAAHREHGLPLGAQQREVPRRGPAAAHPAAPVGLDAERQRARAVVVRLQPVPRREERRLPHRQLPVLPDAVLLPHYHHLLLLPHPLRSLPLPQQVGLGVLRCGELLLAGSGR